MSNSADDPLEHLRHEREYEQVPLGEPEDLARVIRTINDRLYTLAELYGDLVQQIDRLSSVIAALMAERGDRERELQ
jgi:hypothetical protein